MTPRLVQLWRRLVGFLDYWDWRYTHRESGMMSVDDLIAWCLTDERD